MKKATILIIVALFSLSAMAQKTLPAIKAGTAVVMDVDFHGQELQLSLVYKMVTDPVTISWDIGNAGGTYTMTAKALENGTQFNVEQPQPDGVTALADNETFMCISKSAYQSLQKNKTFVYSGLTFTSKDSSDGFKMAGQPVNATYVSTADGKTTAWILNNPDFPYTLSMKGNPSGVDYRVTAIK